MRVKKCGENHAGAIADVPLDIDLTDGYNTPCAAENRHTKTPYGGVAQLARAFGSYPECHLFESDRRYHEKRPARVFFYDLRLS